MGVMVLLLFPSQKPKVTPSGAAATRNTPYPNPGETPQGMVMKARMAALDPTKVSTVDDLEHALEERLETGHIIGLSLILDVLDLHGGDA